MIHVMAATGLGGAAMAAPVVGYDAIALLEEEKHLRVPIIGRQRPAVAEHDGLTFAPVLVEDLNAVFGGDRGHVIASRGVVIWWPVQVDTELTVMSVRNSVGGRACAARRRPQATISAPTSQPGHST